MFDDCESLLTFSFLLFWDRYRLELQQMKRNSHHLRNGLSHLQL